MGITGTGKCSLISLCTEKGVRIGHDPEPCTQVVNVFACEYTPSTTVFLIDTPGFDDTDRSDTDVFHPNGSFAWIGGKSETLVERAPYQGTFPLLTSNSA